MTATRFDRLINRLTLEEQSPSVFVGGAGAGGIGGEARLFGGLVAAQAAVAAMNTVDDFPMHSLHAYFLRPGRAEKDIAYHVHALKDGRNFRSRSVEAWQGGDCIFHLTASFQRPEEGVTHQPSMPSVPEPLTLPNRDQLRGRENWREMPIDVRMISEITADTATTPDQQLWVRANGALPDTRLNLAFAVYASDRSLLDTAWRPHADQGNMSGASLDHAMWFHRPPQFDDWHLYSIHSPVAGGARGLAIGHMFDKAGNCVVTVAQEGRMQVRQA